MTTLTAPSSAHAERAYASGVDAAAHGEFRRPARVPSAFAARLGTPSHPAVAGRYHVYGGWACPASHRLAIIRQLAGLTDVVSMSYVDTLRDGRGWAFREATGADPINGFTLLREAYEATDPQYAGAVTVPLLWDIETSGIVSNSAVGIGVDLATRFAASGAGDGSGSGRSAVLWPAALGGAVERACQRIAAEVESQIGCAVYRPMAAAALRRTLNAFDGELATNRYLLGDDLTDADVRLWVQLVRFDAGANAHHAIGPRLDRYPNLWRWALELYRQPAFGTTTDFARFSAPLADLPPWD